jgi:hypothetical protein
VTPSLSKQLLNALQETQLSHTYPLTLTTTTTRTFVSIINMLQATAHLGEMALGQP